jgi:micrococcal nuclease
MSKKYVFYLTLACIAGVFVVITVFVVRHTQASIRGSSLVDINEGIHYPIIKVLDGDTLSVKVDEREITVRMLGINTPETVDPRRPAECYGKEASGETKKLLKGHNVQLRLNPDREVLDKYGRYLAYVYRDDGLFVNEYLIRNGFGKEYTYGKPYDEQGKFRKAEEEAKEGKVGLWGECKIPIN